MLKQGLSKPKNIQETREAFPFPLALRTNHIKGIAIARSMEVLHYVHKPWTIIY